MTSRSDRMVEQTIDLEGDTNRDGRRSLTEAFGQGLGTGLTQLGQTVLPQSLVGPNRGFDLDTIVQDFIEFSPVGDVRDFNSARTGQEGGYQLDWAERALGFLGGLSLAGTTVTAGYLGARAVRMQADRTRAIQLANLQQHYAALGQPQPGDPYSLPRATDADNEIGEGPINVDTEGRGQSIEGLRLREMSWEERILRQRGELTGLPMADLLAPNSLEDAGATLVAAHGRGDGQTAAASIAAIGATLIEAKGPDAFHVEAQDAELAGGYDQAMQQAAGAMAIAAMQTALQMDVADFGVDLDAYNDLLTDPDADPLQLGRTIDQTVRFFGKLMDDNIGPDLSGSSVSEVSAVWVDEVTGEVNYANGLGAAAIPERRFFDPEKRQFVDGGEGIDQARVDATVRWLELDPMALVGLYSHNVETAWLEAHQKQSPAQIQRSKNWYLRANRSMRIYDEALANLGFDTSGPNSMLFGHVATVLSGQTAWMPTNFVGAFHVTSQHHGLQPGTPEYLAVFEKVVDGWKHDLWDGTSQEKRALIYGPESVALREPGDWGPLIEYWADPANSMKSEAPTEMFLGTSGAQNLETSQFGLAGVPWELLQRTSKYGSFNASMFDPLNSESATIDTHSGTISWGTKFKPVKWITKQGETILANIQPQNEGTVSVQKLLKEGGTWTHPTTGKSYTMEQVEQGIDALVAHGLTRAEAEKKLTKVLTQVPGGRSLREYTSMVLAHQTVADKYGVAPNVVQSTPWVDASEAIRRGLPTAVQRARNVAELTAVEMEMTPNTSIYAHIEGNPLGHANVMGMTANASRHIPKQPPKALRKAMKKKPIVTWRDGDQTHVLADLTKPGVARAVRHLYDTGLQVGSHQLMVPRSPHRVMDVDTHSREMSEKVPGAKRTWVQGVRHPISEPGNFIVLDVDQQGLDALNEAIGNGDIPPIIREQGRASRQSRVPQPSELNTARGLEAALNQYDWMMLSAEGGPRTTEQLKRDLQDQGLVPIPMKGVYRGASEASFLVFGADQNQYLPLLQRYGQESVMTDRGLLFSDGTLLATDGLQVDTTVPDVPTRRAARNAIPELTSLVEDYIARTPGAYTGPLTVETVQDGAGVQGAIARYFEEADLVDPSPAVKASYDAAKRELLAQYQMLKDAGYKMIPVVDGTDHYGPNSKAMAADARDHKRNYFFITMSEGNFGGPEELARAIESGHPMLEKTGEVINGYEMTYNDVLRTVHDLVAHAAHEHSFGPIGEENAWRAHMRMFTPEARPAVTMETRGQNSWVNFGPHLRRKDGTLPRQGDPDYIPPRDRPYSEQKVGMLPSEFNEPDWGSVDESFSSVTLPTGQSVAVRLQVGESETQFTPEPVREVNAPVHQVKMQFGGPEFSMPWDQSDRIFKHIRAHVPHSSMAVYTHGDLWNPGGLVEVNEAVYTDPAGRTATYRYKGPQRGLKNETTVLVPDGEAALMGGAELTPGRTMAEARDMLSVQGNRASIDGDLAFQFPEGAEVNWKKTGTALNFEVDGETIREFSVDLNGPVPTIRVEPVPNGVTVELDGRGRVSLIRADTWEDGFLTAEAMAQAGAIGRQDLTDLIRVEEEPGSVPADSDAPGWNFSPSKGLQRPKRATARADEDLMLGETFGVDIDLPGVTSSQRMDVGEALSEALEAGLPKGVLASLTDGITVAKTPASLGRPVAAMYEIDGKGIVLDASWLQYGRENRGYRLPEGFAVRGDLKGALHHELGHALEHIDGVDPVAVLKAALKGDSRASAALARRSQQSRMSDREAWAETFSWYVNDRGTMPDALRGVVESVLEVASARVDP